VKPTPSIATPQQTYNFETGKVEELVIKGRHDACIALRVPVVVEAIAAIVMADLFLLK
jgi:chorismate synthase